MRWFGHGLAGSVAAHVAIVGVLAWWLERTDHREPEADAAPAADVEIDVTPVLTPPPPSMPIALVTMPKVPEVAPPIEAPAAAPIERPARDAASRPRREAMAATSSGTAAPPPETAPGPPGMLAMRGLPHRPELRAGDLGATLERIAEGGKPPPPPVAESGRLSPDGGGTARIDDLTFTADVGRDGTVHFHDKRNFNVHLKVPGPKAIGRGLAAWAQDPLAFVESGEQPKPGEVAPRGDQAPINADDQKPDAGKTVGLIGGGFDVTDWIARKALGKQGDPYAARKLAALDATRAERVEMGRRYRSQQLADADQIVRRTLTAEWSSGQDLATRRRAFFEMWDDCAETGDPELVTAGRRARKAIIGFIRAHLPAGSPGAYTADELAALNARRTSKAVFAPYDADLATAPGP